MQIAVQGTRDRHGLVIAYMRVAFKHEERGEIEKAAMHYHSAAKAAVMYYPTYTYRAYAGLARLHEAQGKFEAALAYLALVYDSTVVASLDGHLYVTSVVRIKDKQGKYSEALACCREAVTTLRPNDPRRKVFADRVTAAAAGATATELGII